MTILHMDVADRKQRLWTEARENGAKMQAALADGDRILAKLYAYDVIDSICSLNEIEHQAAVSQFMDPANYNQTKQKVEAVA